jgi:hypothetical protein
MNKQIVVAKGSYSAVTFSTTEGQSMAKHWINDEDETKLLSKYIVNDKHYGMWALQIRDNTHDFFVVTEMGQVLGSKHCTMEGPTYALFDGSSVKLAQVAPHLVIDDIHAPRTFGDGGEATPGRSVKLKEFRLSILEYMKTKGDVYCCSARRSKMRI